MIQNENMPSPDWETARRWTPGSEQNPMLQKFDFTDQAQNTATRQMVAIEQLGMLCGLNRRRCRRIGKIVFLILSNFPPETLIENSVSFRLTNQVWWLDFQFLTHPLSLHHPAFQNANQNLGSLRRAGEKLEQFNIAGTADEGIEICFAERVGIEFEIPRAREMKQWGRAIARGDWEDAFERLSKIYLSSRAKIQQLREGISIRREALASDQGQQDVILSLVASKSDNAMMILDERGNIEWINRALHKLTGIHLRDDRQQHAAEVLWSNAESSSREDFDSSLAAGHRFNVEYLWRPNVEFDAENEAASQPMWIEFQIAPVRDEEDVIVRWIAIGADVTRRRQAELAMHAAKEVAESASKAKSDFLAMMSHEIRTPMNAIIGMTELTLATNLTMEQREYLAAANSSARSLLQILNDILDLSKVEAARLEIEQTDFNLADLVRETLETLSVLAHKKNLALRCRFALDIPQQCVGDPVRIRQILVNFVGNAIKFTSTGDVTVEADLTEETNERATIHFAVHDTGVGIAEDKISRIFEAFYQSDASVTRTFGGTGLGLAITSELVRLMGGRIWVESKLGSGSSFHFVLTLPKSTRPMIGVDSKTDTVVPGNSFLIVSGDAAKQKLLDGWIRQWGGQTRLARDAAEAMATLSESEAGPFDVALIDEQLSDLRGLQLAQQILSRRANKVTPIVSFDSEHRRQAIQYCRAAGIENYLVNPVSPGSLSRAIQNALGIPITRLSTDEMLDGLVSTTATGQIRSTVIEPTDQPLNILIADDHASNRKLVSEILRRRGHQWHEASDGRQAVELIRENHFDVVLMDVQMPQRDGLQTTTDVRELESPKSQIPIIAITAYATEDDRQRCLIAGMNDYLAKPINISELLDKVERWGKTIRETGSPVRHAADAGPQLILDVPDWATPTVQAVLIAEDGITATAPDDSLLVDGGEGVESEFQAALVRLGGDVELLKMQMGFFVQETPHLLQTMEKSIRQNEAKELQLNAHRLKGLVRSYDDELSADLAVKLEDMGRTGEFQDAQATLSLLAACIENLTRRITAFVGRAPESISNNATGEIQGPTEDLP